MSEHDTDPMLDEAVTSFVRAARILDAARLHVWDERGLTLPQLRILFRVRTQPGSGVRDLALAFGVSASNVTQQIDKLVARGLIDRSDRPDDRRQVSLKLTETGEQVAGEVSHETRSHLSAVLNRLEPEERSDLVRLLGRIAEVAEESGPVPVPPTRALSHG